jgi:hypothetical protein
LQEWSLLRMRSRESLLLFTYIVATERLAKRWNTRNTVKHGTSTHKRSTSTAKRPLQNGFMKVYK